MKFKNSIFKQIMSDNEKREQTVLSLYACRNSHAVRQYPQREKKEKKRDIRTSFFRDTDRIMHSRAYSRYIDKTQAFYLFENDHITRRALHVQFVAKIGRVIGRCLKLNEDLIEAIALGHDLGHVPYGHEGEKILNDICKKRKIGCFCHNVQSVRTLKEIENNGAGLNLTLQVFDGILAHNGEILEKEYRPDYKKDWDSFEAEYQKCMLDEHYSRTILPMTLEGCVARISDIIAYIGRDIEDAVRVRLIKKTGIPKGITEVLGNSNDRIIDTLVTDLINNSFDVDYLTFSGDIFSALNDLLAFNREHIYDNKKIKDQNEKIEHMFRHLFAKYVNHLERKNTDSPLYSSFLKYKNPGYKEQTDTGRIVVDFIAGMTDDYFNNQYNQLFVPQSYGYSV